MSDDVGLQLTGRRILVRPPKREEKSKGGILLPRDTIEKEERAATTGILISAAKDAWDCKEMAGIKIGDNLFYARYAGDNVPFTKDGVEYKVMNAEDVVGVLSEQPDDPFRPTQTQREQGVNETVPA